MSTVTSGDKQALITAIRSVQKVDNASGAYAATWQGKTTYIKPEQYEAFSPGLLPRSGTPCWMSSAVPPTRRVTIVGRPR
jgi:hypothetical protein